VTGITMEELLEAATVHRSDHDLLRLYADAFMKEHERAEQLQRELEESLLEIDRINLMLQKLYNEYTG